MLIRLAINDDADALFEVFVRARERMSYLPDLHTEEETRAFIRGLPNEGEVWVAEQEQRVLGFASIRAGVLEHLYVHPIAQGFGTGSTLLDHVKARTKGELCAWVFQKNKAARRFFESRGFELLEVTDGAKNEEQEPDALYRWKP